VIQSTEFFLEADELNLIAKSLGWRLEFLKESRSLGFDGEIVQIETILCKMGVVTIVDPDSGEVQIIRIDK